MSVTNWIILFCVRYFQDKVCLEEKKKRLIHKKKKYSGTKIAGSASLIKKYKTKNLTIRRTTFFRTVFLAMENFFTHKT